MVNDDRLEIIHKGRAYEVLFRRHQQATRFTLRVRAACREVVLTAPLRSRRSEATKFAVEHAEWIHTKLSQIAGSIPFQHGSLIPIRGVEYQIVHLRNERGVVTMERSSVELSIPRPLFFYVYGREEHVERRTRDFLKALAMREIGTAVSSHCKTLNIKCPPITVRDTISRWGSCSSSGTLNFSWRLIFAPPFILDYLAAHEVAHLREMNHSARFWTIVERLAPQTQLAEKWLDQHGANLHRYGAKLKKSDS